MTNYNLKSYNSFSFINFDLNHKVIIKIFLKLLLIKVKHSSLKLRLVDGTQYLSWIN